MAGRRQTVKQKVIKSKPEEEFAQGCVMMQVTYHCLQSIFQHLHLTKGTRTGPPGGGSLAARTAGALPQTNGAGNGGAYGGGAAASYPAAGTSGTGRTAVQEEALAVFNTSNAQSSEVGISVDQVGMPSAQQNLCIKSVCGWASAPMQPYSRVPGCHVTIFRLDASSNILVSPLCECSIASYVVEHNDGGAALSSAALVCQQQWEHPEILPCQVIGLAAALV